MKLAIRDKILPEDIDDLDEDLGHAHLIVVRPDGSFDLGSDPRADGNQMQDVGGEMDIAAEPGRAACMTCPRQAADEYGRQKRLDGPQPIPFRTAKFDDGSEQHPNQQPSLPNVPELSIRQNCPCCVIGEDLARPKLRRPRHTLRAR